MKKRKNLQHWLRGMIKKLSQNGIYQLQMVSTTGEKCVITLGTEFTKQDTEYVEQLCEEYLNVPRISGIGFQLVRVNPRPKPIKGDYSYS
jgi:hypothetical protein